MYESLNKQLKIFQNCLGVFFRLCQGKSYCSLLWEHDTAAGNLLFASSGLRWSSLTVGWWPVVTKVNIFLSKPWKRTGGEEAQPCLPRH